MVAAVHGTLKAQIKMLVYRQIPVSYTHLDVYKRQVYLCNYLFMCIYVFILIDVIYYSYLGDTIVLMFSMHYILRR